MKKGAEWVSITNDLVEYLLSKKEEVLKNFKFISCPDEIYKQTLVWNSKFRSKVYAINDEYASCLRAIDWSRGTPYCWGQGGVNLMCQYLEAAMPCLPGSLALRTCGLLMR